MHRLVTRDFSFEAPVRIDAGLVRLRLVNEGHDVHEAVVVRVVGEGSAARYVEAWNRGVSWPAFGEDVGGVALTSPADSNEAWLRLEPGHYILICTKGDHLNRGMAADLEVVPSTAPAPPSPVADLSLELFDFAFRFPARIAAGGHLIHAVNRGTDPHEMDIYRIPPAKSLADFVAWSKGGEKGPPPLELAGGGADFFPGHEEWIPISLTPGRYLIICTITKGKLDNAPHHYALGMTSEFVE